MKTLTTLVCTAMLASAIPAQKTIVDTAVAAGSFKTLARALGAAELVDTLQGPGPFTVFAPTDDAFARLPKHMLAALLEPGKRDRLTRILLHHVAPGRLSASEVVNRSFAPTVGGQRVSISVSGDEVRVGDARVIKTDIRCKNGIIHVIDRVLMPSEDTIVEVARNAGSFKTLLRAAKAAGLAKTLSGKGPFTVLAPTDEAFAKLPAKTLKSLLQPANKKRLAAILKYHVIPGRIYSDQALQASSGKTAQGSPVAFKLSEGRLKAGGANVVLNDVQASNGVVHVIDSVLLPPEPRGRKVIGVYTEKPSQALASQLKLDRNQCLLVTRLTSGGNAAKAGLERYDVITRISGRPATSASLSRAKEDAGAGGSIPLTVLRAGRERRVSVAVGLDPH